MKARALYANTADTEEELTFKPGDLLTVHEQDVAGLVGWWLCSMGDRTGIAPGNRLKIIPDIDSPCRASSSAPHPVTSQACSRMTDSSNKLVIPRKSGNVYIYDTPTQHETDYDVPSGQQCPVMTSLSDYDVPHGNASTDYDVPIEHRNHVNHVDHTASRSNRSSVVSVQSTGSLSSVTSGRDHHHLATSPESIAGNYTRSLRDSVLDDYDVPRCDFLSDGSTSADSGVYCGFQGSKIRSKPTAAHCHVTDKEEEENHDYDVPEAYTAGSRQAEVKTVVAVDVDQSDVPTMLRDNAMKNVERLEHWLNSEQTNHWSIQVKLAGLALRTSLQELISVDEQSTHHTCKASLEQLAASLNELSRCLDCFMASSSSSHPYAVSPGNRLHQPRTMTSHCSANTFEAIQRLTASLPTQIRQFFDDITAATKSPCMSSVTRHSHNSSPQSSVTSPPRTALCRKKPPPVKPKPPKQLIMSVRRQNNATQQHKNTPDAVVLDDDGLSDDCDYAAIASEAERQLGTGAPHQRRIQSQKTVSLPPRPLVSAKPPIAKRPEVAANSAAGTRSQLNDADRELIEFYAIQIAAHSSVVETAARDFYQHTSASSTTVTSYPAEVFVRRSRFVVLAGHKLVYLGDSLARHVTDELVRDRVAMAANELCDKLKTVVMTTKQAALATSGDVELCVRRVNESVTRATDGCRHLTSIIREISQR